MIACIGSLREFLFSLSPAAFRLQACRRRQEKLSLSPQGNRVIHEPKLRLTSKHSNDSEVTSRSTEVEEGSNNDSSVDSSDSEIRHEAWQKAEISESDHDCGDDVFILPDDDIDRTFQALAGALPKLSDDDAKLLRDFIVAKRMERNHSVVRSALWGSFDVNWWESCTSMKLYPPLDWPEETDVIANGNGHITDGPTDAIERNAITPSASSSSRQLQPLVHACASQNRVPCIGRSLTENLLFLSQLDNWRVVTLRRVNKIIAQPSEQLMLYFSQFGQVEHLLVSRSCGRTTPVRYRIASIAFVVFRKAEEAEAALAYGKEQVVAGIKIGVAPFKSDSIEADSCVVEPHESGPALHSEATGSSFPVMTSK